ncbi:LamG-like jellyroll fold domain-containing protein [Paenisporosarcina sp. OV554]|uniref:LamG-like jellyroll fold domain-containing protein n=1 Tax=Paenisporosarcina sp. OV554 TaxID=2135694 RepID=UPI000D35AF6E|nr:LamG-like jellyroll fold domain-containing protein [Paenisporosarcina sp. OV554]PUB08339.1 3',5'-cyclic AMP phosphodiesterase CpdA [Paenisporosarcina sp. OV554]
MLFLKRLKKSFLSLMLVNVALMGVVGSTAAESSAAGAENTTEDPIFSFMSISDTHSDTGKTVKAVTDAVNNNASAIVLSGDITNLGDSGEYDAIINAVNSVKDHPPVYYGMGNHEYDWQSDFNVAKNRFIQKAGIPENKVYYHREIQGYDFIFLGKDEKPANTAYMSDEQLAWLESTLAANAVPDKPIFVFMHEPIYQTVSKSYASDNYAYNTSPQEQKLKHILEKYPQAILTTGHLHDDIKIPGNMYTEKFSALRDGAVLNSQAMIFDVYKDKVHLKGRDVNTQKTVWEGTISLHPNTTGMYEAEESVFAYATAGDDILSGGKYVNMNHGSAYIESLTVDGGASGGNKILKIRYATDAANATKGLYVNGAKVQTLSFPTTGSMSSYNDLAVPVELNPGPNNKIVIKSDSNATGVNIDKFQIMDSADPRWMWGFNGNGKDSIKYGFNATLHGSAAYDKTDKMEGSASLSLNGADDDYAGANLVSKKTDNVTLTAWVKWNGATSGSQQILSNGDGLSNGYSIVLDHDHGDKVSIAINGQTILGSQTALTAGQWTNITAARRSGTWELYTNGKSTPVTNNTTAPSTPTTGTYIGADGSGKQSFNGRIDAVRVYNQALSTDQIMAIANETSNVKLQSIEITKPPTKLNYLHGDWFNIEGLIVTGTYSDGTTKEEKVTVDNITGFNSSILKEGQQVTVTLGGKTASFNVNILDVLPGSASVPGRIEGVNYNSKHGVLLKNVPIPDGGPTWMVNYLIKGDWMEYNVDVKSSGTYQVTYRAGTAPGRTGEVEFQVDGVPQTKTSFSTSGWYTFDNKTDLVKLSEGPHKIRLNVTEAFWILRWFELTKVEDKTLNSITVPAPVTVPIGTAKTAAALGLPAKVALVTDGGDRDASVNWDVNSANYDPTATTAQTFTVTGKVTLPIGVANPNSVPLTTSISVSSKPAELVAHWKFDEGSGTTVGDASGKGNTGTLVNNPAWNSSGKIGGALAFSGGSRAEFNSSATLNKTGDESVSLWFKTSQPATGFTSIFRNSNRFTALQLAGGQARAAYWTNGSSGYKALYFPWTYNDNNWHHYAATYDHAQGLKIYVDGNLVASKATDLGPLPTVTSKIVLGATETGGEAYNGLLDDVRVFDLPLTQDEVRQLSDQQSPTTTDNAPSGSVN